MCCGEEVPRPGVQIPGEPSRGFGPQLWLGVGFERLSGAYALVDRNSAVGRFQRPRKRYHPRGGPRMAEVRQPGLFAVTDPNPATGVAADE